MILPRIAVVGAGPSGLAAAKAVLEAGLQPVVFEASGQPGGLWEGPGQAAWSDFARTNISRDSCVFSDLPWPADSEVFPIRGDLAGYLQQYADTFDISRHVRFGAQVPSIEATGEAMWRVCWQNVNGAGSAAFDHVIIASGFFAGPHRPKSPGLAAFAGEVAPCAEVTVTFRRPMWFVPRWVQATIGGAQYPLDLVIYNRRADNPLRRDPHRFLRRVGGDPGAASLELAFDRDGEDHAAIIVSDAFLDLVRGGAVAVKRSATLRFDRWGVGFTDGIGQTVVPFFLRSVLDIISSDGMDPLQPKLLHRDMFHPDLPNLTFIGQYRGPNFPVIKWQSCWIAQILAGERPMPERGAMLAGVAEQRAMRARDPRPQFPHGDFVALADGLAREVGVHPVLLETGPLAVRLTDGPVIPAHYRLSGPHATPVVARNVVAETPAPILDDPA